MTTSLLLSSRGLFSSTSDYTPLEFYRLLAPTVLRSTPLSRAYTGMVIDYKVGVDGYTWGAAGVEGSHKVRLLVFCYVVLECLLGTRRSGARGFSPGLAASLGLGVSLHLVGLSSP